MTKEEIKIVLDKHSKWLNQNTDGCRADFYNTNLYHAVLHYANLHYAVFQNADLRHACLRGANLRDANLYYADLRGADLRYADLRGADLRCADLRGANLCYADLRGVHLWETDFSNADLCNTNIDIALLNRFYPIVCPETGSFIAWKKARGKIVKLEVCEDALRSSAFSRKCRCSKAKVLAIENIDGTPADTTSINSNYDSDFVYRIGEIVEIADFDTDRKNECAPGIHFFVTRQEAVDW